MATKKRPRTLRRELERERDKLAKTREALEAVSPGGSPAIPVEVESASQVEPHARSMHCPVCGDAYRVKEHAAAASGLRVVSVESPQCGRTTRLWFRIRPPLPN